MERATSQSKAYDREDALFGIKMDLIMSISRPDLAKSQALTNWIWFVAEFLESVQRGQSWAFGKVTRAPNVDDDEFAATIAFTCAKVSVTAEIGVFGPVDKSSVWMGLDNVGRVVEFNDEEFTILKPDSLSHIFTKMLMHIRERQMDLARGGSL